MHIVYRPILTTGKKAIVSYESTASKGSVSSFCKIGYWFTIKPFIYVNIASVDIIESTTPFNGWQIIITDVDAKNGK